MTADINSRIALDLFGEEKMLMGAEARDRWSPYAAPFGSLLAAEMRGDAPFIDITRPSRVELLPPVAMADFPAVLSLATLNGSNGFRLDGIALADHSGASVSSAGDINGDGFDDIIIGAPDTFSDAYADPGESYVVFGKPGGFAASLDLATLNGSNGFRINGAYDGDSSGRSVSSAGDVNGDGFDDIIIGAPGSYYYGGFGDAYVVFGKAGGFAASLDPATLDGSNGFRIFGVDRNDECGSAVSDAGDINGDGFDDIIVGARYADPDGDPVGDVDAGESYVVFGKAGGFTAGLNLDTLNGSNGFRIYGIDGRDFSGTSVSSAGDINGDGFDDIIIGAPGDFFGGFVGESYVVFGKASGFAASLSLATLDGSNGFRIDGVSSNDRAGFSVSGAGDVNGDGYADMIIGAYGADPGGRSSAGRSYIVLGKAGGFGASINLASFTGSFVDGGDPGDESGRSVSAAGDVNGDGFDDVIVGASEADPGGDDRAGEAYVVFGSLSGIPFLDLSTLNGSNGFRLDGIDVFDYSGQSVSAAGDVDGDGFDDIIIGADGGDPGGDASAGESYVVFGRAPTAAVSRTGSAAGQTIRGGDFNDTLEGLGGADTLAGGEGKDKLKGGGGLDDYVLASTDAADADKIASFAPGIDDIALDGDVFGLSEGRLNDGRFVVGTAAGDGSDRLIYNDATGKLFFDPDGTGAQAQVLIATLNGAPTIDAADFIVI